MDHTVLPAITPCLPFLRKRSPDSATLTEVADINCCCSLLQFIDLEMEERFSWPGWLAYSGLQSREWVMGQMGHENRMGHMGHGSLGVDP